MVSEGDVPLKLNELRKLCSGSKLIPDSMKLEDDGDQLLKAAESFHPTEVFRGTFKNREVAVKITQLHVPRKGSEILKVGIRSSSDFYSQGLISLNNSRDMYVEILQ